MSTLLTKQRCKVLVSGYIHECQTKLDQIIPSVIMEILFDFYYVGVDMASLILSEHEKYILYTIIKPRKYQIGFVFKSIYRGSRDGFQANDFHSKCDGIPNTICIIETCKNNVFGGFTKIPWEAMSDENHETYGLWKQDMNAFLFLLRSSINIEPTAFELNIGSLRYAVNHNKNWLCCFGGGWTLRVKNGCNTNNKSSLSNGTYKIDGGAARLNGGNDRFCVKEIEVFQCVNAK